MDWNDAAKDVWQLAWSHRGELGKVISMLRRKRHGASGDEPLVTEVDPVSWTELRRS